jgi:DNA-binding SARP family transcriptional activator
MKDPALAPFCGRDHELGRLLGALEECLRGEPRVAWISAEAGAGKSRILAEAAGRLAERGLLVLSTRAAAGMTVLTLLSDLVRPFLLQPGHAKRLRAELPSDLLRDLDSELPRDPVGRPGRSRAGAAVKGAARRAEAIISLLAWLAERRPVAALFDDLQEAPDEVCDLFRRLLVRARRAPLFLLVAVRPDEISRAKDGFAAEMERQQILLRIDLAPLSEGDVGLFAGSLFDPALGRRISRWLWSVSRGNPLFTIEVLRFLFERGTIARSASPRDAWEVVGALPETVAPPHLAALMADRFTRLDPPARKLAAALAVHGSQAPASGLARSAHLLPEESGPALAALVRGQWVASDPSGTARDPVSFVHPLMERVIYDGLSMEERSALHAHCARFPPAGWSPDRADAWFARHAWGSGDPALLRRALPPALRAASAAAAAGEASRAAVLYETALAICSDQSAAGGDEFLAEALLGRAGALRECGRLEEARENLERAAGWITETTAPVPPLAAARVNRHLGDVLAALGRFAEGTGLLEKAFRTAVRASARRAGADADPALVKEAARAAIRLVFVEFQQGRFQEALAWGRRARPLVERAGEPELRGHLLNNMGLVYWSTGRLTEAAEAFRHDLEIAGHGPSRARKAGGREGDVARTSVPDLSAFVSPAEAANACSNLGLIYWNLGKIEEAERLITRAIAIHKEGGRLLAEAASQQNMALLLEERGDFEAAARLNHHVLDTVVRLGDRRAAMQVWGNLGGNYLELGRLEEAGAYLDRARTDAEELGVRGVLPDIITAQSRLQTALGHPQAGRDLAQEVLALTQELELPFDCGRSLRALAQAEAALGLRKSALRHLEESVVTFARMGAELEAAKSRLEEAWILAGTDALEAARSRVGQALEAFLSRGLRARAASARMKARKLGIEPAVPPEAERESVAPARPGEEPPAIASRPVAEGTYRIRCFGPLRVFRPGEADPVSQKEWESHKARQILAYLLAVDPLGHGVTREKILAAVWPEAAPDTLGHTFHVTVSHLRRALAGRAREAQQPILQEGGIYRLSWPAGAWVDAQEFAAALARAAELERSGQPYAAEAEYRRAAALAEGDYLDDVHFAWAEALRVQYRQGRCLALRRQAQAALTRWDFPRAEELARKLLAEEPLDEAAHRIVIHALLEEDRRAEALAQYRYCAQLLRSELGLQPSPETSALIKGRPR